MCFWPPNTLSQAKVAHAIKTQAEPMYNWNSYAATKLKEYGDYTLAVQKAKKAQVDSNLSSQDDQYPRGRGYRKKSRPNKISSSSESDIVPEDEAFPTPPARKKLAMHDYSNESTPSHTNYDYETLGRLQSQHVSLNVSSITNKEKLDGSHTLARKGVRVASLHCQSRFYPGPSFIRKSGITVSEDNRGVSNSSFSRSSSDIGINVDNRRVSSPLCSRNELTVSGEFQAQVLRQLTLINFKLSQHSQNFEVLLSAHNQNNVEVTEQSDLTKWINLFALQRNDLLQLETFLTQDAKQIPLLAKELSRVGGSTPKHITKRLLYRMLSNEVGSLYSWEGLKGKHIFKTLNIATVIIKAVRFNDRTATSCEDEIINTIKLWLVRAKDRLKNAQKKQEQNGAAQDDANA